MRKIQKAAAVLILMFFFLAAVSPAVSAQEIAPTVTKAVFRPGAARVEIYLDNGPEPRFLEISTPPELRGGRMYVPLDAVCQIMDSSVDLSGDCAVITFPTGDLYRVPATKRVVEKLQQGDAGAWAECILPLRQVFQTAGYRVTWDQEMRMAVVER
ncbi:hypothetical protein G7K71_02925 [Desulfofundulus sp. TPOSR]|uniref:hypothetical protein n=1 Tax=Desulfofundulus sp. TPOSR TaxID=2714340 RepID=UPI0014074265|nr:hypothetical protein [Desulfofundulus sp. TPOSR]NHM25980.1 hypothetical protein [Desulfofundulus sp. TPOSR]